MIFRGGTALYKIHHAPVRYSEDIDLVQSSPEPIGQTLDRARSVLDPWLGKPRRQLKEGRVNLVYRFESEDTPPLKLKLKIEINTREHFTELGVVGLPYEVANPWFSGAANVTTYNFDELLATKFRALYQRKKGRDLFDVWLGLQEKLVDPSRFLACFQRYMHEEGRSVTRAQFEENLAGKREQPDFRDAGQDAGQDAGDDLGGDDRELSALDDSYETNEDVELLIPADTGVLANDSSLTGGPLTAELVTDVSHGTLTLDPDGGFLYLPGSDFFGPEAFVYRVDDAGQKSDPATVTIIVLSVNDRPVGVEDAYQVTEDQVLEVDAASGVLANDTDLEGDDLQAWLEIEALRGSIDLAPDDSFTYTPDPDFFGSDRFFYRANDGEDISLQTWADIEVLPADDPPVAHPDDYYVETGVLFDPDPGVSVLDNDVEPDSESLTASLVADVTHGVLQLESSGRFTYLPDTGFEGTDTFVYEAIDPGGSSSSAQVTLWVLAGMQMAWVASAGGSSSEEAHAAAAFEDGSVVITGTLWESTVFGAGEPNETTLASGGDGANFFIARYHPDGRSIDCGNGTVAIVDCADLADCPGAVQVPEVERDPLAVRFRNTDDSYTDLFVCQ